MPAPLFIGRECMEEKIRQLYKSLRDDVIEYMYYQSVKNCDEIVALIPQIQEFLEWFMGGNIFGIEEEIYAGMCNDLIDILKDILEAVEQRDHVLLNDAVAYGLMEYLKLFMEEGEYDENEI